MDKEKVRMKKSRKKEKTIICIVMLILSSIFLSACSKAEVADSGSDEAYEEEEDEIVDVGKEKISYVDTRALVEVEKKDDNPNVYAQNKNDFIDINKLNEVKAPVISALEGLNIVENKSDIFDGNTVMVEEKKEKNMIEVPNAKDAEQAPKSIIKVKLATAIRIAKDALDSITAAGYNVTMEEVDGLTDYQIIIKVEK